MAYLWVIQSINKLLIVQDVSLWLEQKLENSVFYRFQLVFVCIDLGDELVTLLFKIWSL